MYKDKYLNYYGGDKYYFYLYKKYKKKYLQLKQIGGMPPRKEVLQAPEEILKPVEETLQAAEETLQVAEDSQSNQLKDGELWFFNSIGITPDRIRCQKFMAGHIGISFDRNRYDNNKEIFGFSPESWDDFLSCDTEECVTGTVSNDKDYFDDFLKTCTPVNMKPPNYLYKINIKYLDEKKELFKSGFSTYSHPVKAPKNFQEKFDSLEEFNNCITYLVNTVEPLIEEKDGRLISINLKKNLTLDGWYSGGYIGAFTEEFVKYADIPEIILIIGPMSFGRYNTIKGD